MTVWLVGRLWRGAGGVQVALAAVLVATTALATVVVLLMASVPEAFERQENRLAWTGMARDWTAQADPTTDDDYVYVYSTVDHVAERTVMVVNVAVHGEGVQPPDGVGRFPGPGEALVSRALEDALAHHPDAAERYGRVVGEVGAGSLLGPEHLMVVRGATEQQLAPVAVPMLRLAQEPVAGPSTTLTLLILLGGVALLVPPLLLAYTATSSLNQAHRRRMANLVIAGAPSSLVRRIVVGETLAATALGLVVGGALFTALRPPLVHLLVTESAPYPDDLSPPWVVVVLVVLGLPLVVTGMGLRTARTAVQRPLATTVTAREPRPTTWTAATGAVLLVTAAAIGWTGVVDGTRQTLLLMLLGALGLVLLLPWLNRAAGRGLLVSRHPAVVLSGGWLEAAPWSAARGVAAASLAVFVATVFVLLNPTAVSSAPVTVVQQAAGTVAIQTRALDSEGVAVLIDDLRRIDGVAATASVIQGSVQTGENPARAWVGDCSGIATAAALAELDCDGPGAAWATSEVASAQASLPLQVTGLAPAAVRPLIAAPEPGDLDALPVPPVVPVLQTAARATDRPHLVIDPVRARLDVSAFRPTLILVRTADNAALAQVRSTALQADPAVQVSTRDTSREGFDGSLRQYYSTMLWGAAATFLTVAAGLFASGLTGIAQRSRSTAVLQAVGTSAGTLRGAVLLTLCVPMVLGSVVAVLVGVVCAGVVLEDLGAAAGVGLLGLWPLLPGIVLATAAGALAVFAVPRSVHLGDLPGE